IQMCNGIGAAHDAQIIHRDIKPQNILITRDGKVKVTDFGIAKATTSNTISSNAMGSVHYTSPEQARGGFSDAKSDIYSIGITMFEMVTGEVPFDGDSTVSVAIKHLQEEITPPSKLVPDIPYSLEQIILKCTQKNGERRYSNTTALIQDLKRSLVNPDGDFVVIPPLRNADTVIITDEELDDIRNSYDEYDDEYDDRYDDEQYDDDDYDNEQYDDDYDDDDYGKKGSRKRKSGEEVNPRMNKIMKILTIVVIIIVAFILLFTIGKAAGIFKSFGTGITTEEEEKQVKVPDVVGKTEAEAKEILNKAGLGYSVKARQESEKYEKGTVCEQSIKAGEKVDVNTTIEVVVSSKLVGEEIEVPDVSGMDEAEAQSKLEAQGLTVGTPKYVYSDQYGEGEVIGTTPTAGSKVTSETEIIMQVSKGKEKIEVPNVVGKSDTDAQSILNADGLKVNKVTYDYDDSVAKGKVVSQSINPGKKVETGTKIDIVVSKGPKPEEKVEVPSLSGLTYERAKSLLESYGLKAVKGGEEESEEEVGRVSRWSPYNTSVEKGTSITIWISKGYEDTSSGMDQDDE
ncbi:MAG: PASTA domain-containing protein, partial [Dorea sp.]